MYKFKQWIPYLYNSSEFDKIMQNMWLHTDSKKVYQTLTYVYILIIGILYQCHLNNLLYSFVSLCMNNIIAVPMVKQDI